VDFQGIDFNRIIGLYSLVQKLVDFGRVGASFFIEEKKFSGIKGGILTDKEECQ